MTRWLSGFFGAALGASALVLGTWGAWLLLDPAEPRHFEYAIPALVLAFAGGIASVVLRR